MDYSPESEIAIYADDEKITEYTVAQLDAGSGRIIKVTNLRVPSSFEELSFIVDNKQVIFEINEDNNKKTLILG